MPVTQLQVNTNIWRCWTKLKRCFIPPQSTMSASAGSTTATRTPCASTWSGATAAPASPVTPATERSAKVSRPGCRTAFTKGSALQWLLKNLPFSACEGRELLCCSALKCNPGNVNKNTPAGSWKYRFWFIKLDIHEWKSNFWKLKANLWRFCILEIYKTSSATRINGKILIK